jgi:Ca2+-transporting ATPase
MKQLNEQERPITRGLTSSEAKHLREQYGLNEIRREKTASCITLFAHQFTSPLIWLLLIATVLSAFMGDSIDAAAIATILVINAIIGFTQEYKAEQSIIALRKMTAPQARVIRDEQSTLIPSIEIVPGDLLIIEAGDIIPADAMLLEANRLLLIEAALTGESAPAEKFVIPVGKETTLAERVNQVFLGTQVISGTGLAKITATGMKTELGKIAHLISTAQQEMTPLQKRLSHLSATLLYLCLFVVLLVSVIGFLRGTFWKELILSSISLAVAAVPEGLPAIVTIALALGVQRMAARNVLVRKLPSVETLGSVTVICTDKTGTLTTGLMMVRELWGEDHTALLFDAAACCDAELGENTLSGIGDPTEVALLLAAQERGISRREIELKLPRTHTNPFDSNRKRMSILRSNGVLYVKGAFESIAPLCIWKPHAVAQATDEMSDRALRVLAVATGKGKEEKNLSLIGLIGIADPPRTEAIEAVSNAHQAGIHTVMITGDHPLTARAIARELGILKPGMSPADFVHARATAEDKIKIVKDWKKKGEIVAMTGDGVNDAPALKEAHIGIAMGKTGTEVTRESADMILTDDNYASIISAVKEGRGVYENIRKAITYLLTGNTSEILTVLLTVLIGFPIPFLPIHLLWINLVTDSLPALALVADPVSSEILKEKPRSPTEPMIGRPEWKSILFVAGLETSVTLFVYIYTFVRHELNSARSLAFSVLVFSQLFRSFAARSKIHILWELGPLTNFWLFGVVMISFIVQTGLHYIPFTQSLLKLQPLYFKDLAFILGMALIPVSIIELRKLTTRDS